MKLNHTSSTFIDSHSREESARRERVIRQSLQSLLSEDQLLRAISLCKQEFPPHEPFSTSLFCQRLVETIPDIHLTSEARLVLLRELRRTVSEQNVNRGTKTIEIPAALMQAPGEQDAAPNGQHEDREMSSGVQTPGQRSRERRQHPRKPVYLHGHYWAELDDTPTGEIILVDLSLGGTCFRVLSPHRLKKKEHLPLEFKLDDGDATTILQQVEIQWIQADRIGVAWLDKMTVHGALKNYFAI